jgi:hypothetical protein
MDQACLKQHALTNQPDPPPPPLRSAGAKTPAAFTTQPAAGPQSAARWPQPNPAIKGGSAATMGYKVSSAACDTLTLTSAQPSAPPCAAAPPPLPNCSIAHRLPFTPTHTHLCLHPHGCCRASRPTSCPPAPCLSRQWRCLAAGRPTLQAACTRQHSTTPPASATCPACPLWSRSRSAAALCCLLRLSSATCPLGAHNGRPGGGLQQTE